MGQVVYEEGYLEGDYLEGDYSEGTIGWSEGFQIQMVIDDDKATGAQIQMVVDDDEKAGAQVQMVIDDDALAGMQAQMIAGAEQEAGFQAQLVSAGIGEFGVEVKEHDLLHTFCDGYLSGGYLEGPYLAKRYCAHAGMQIELTVNAFEYTGIQTQMIVDDSQVVGAQAQMVIDDDLATGYQTQMVIQDDLATGIQSQLFIDTEQAAGSQIQMVIDDELAVGMQALLQFKHVTGFQINMALYNSDKLRILCDFDSRGTDGENWTASSQQAGDFSPLNLNNDLEEYYWRSADGVITGIDLVCDTQVPQGVLVDTIAIRNTNMTTSGSVVIQGTNDPTFGSVGVEVTPSQTENHIYWIAPTLPLNLYRYWRFRLNDSTNTDGFISIGAILFGQSRIFFQDCQTDSIIRRTKHFSDKIETEGYTNVANDRALKRAITLNFRNLEFNGGSFQILDDIFNFARTNLKCLWIPDPRQRMLERFTVFAKMRDIPDEQHNVKGDELDFISMTVDLDESL